MQITQEGAWRIGVLNAIIEMAQRTQESILRAEGLIPGGYPNQDVVTPDHHSQVQWLSFWDNISAMAQRYYLGPRK
jgi:hypothetical protein